MLDDPSVGIQVGVAGTAFTRSTTASNDGVGDDDASWGVDGGRRLLWHAGHGSHRAPWRGTPWRRGDVIGIAVDLERGALAVSVNGSFDPPNGDAFDCVRSSVAAGAAVYPALSAKNMTVALNLGLDPARPLRFAPPWTQSGSPSHGGAVGGGVVASAAVPRLRAGDAVRMRAELGTDGRLTGAVAVFLAAAGGGEVEVRGHEPTTGWRDPRSAANRRLCPARLGCGPARRPSLGAVGGVCKRVGSADSTATSGVGQCSPHALPPSFPPFPFPSSRPPSHSHLRRGGGGMGGAPRQVARLCTPAERLHPFVRRLPAAAGAVRIRVSHSTADAADSSLVSPPLAHAMRTHARQPAVRLRATAPRKPAASALT
jgi:hypothetical protein